MFKSVELNGKTLDNPFLPYSELKEGGTLMFNMGPKPSHGGLTRGFPNSMQ